jgi:16S rRNA (adenine1518-N6/adenine1519-N6)-dimethyltransferase
VTFKATPRKRFGQHWLKSEAILHEILAASELTRGDRVLEIGPGTGLLTKWLVSLAGAVIAVEVDWDLCRKLRETFAKADQFLLLQGDFLTLDLGEVLAQHPDFQAPNKVVANIPYYITGPILEKLLGTIDQPNPQPFDCIVLLVQQEVAERLCATAGSRAFGALSVRVQYLADCQLVCPVPPHAFQPAPKVASAVVRLRPRQHFPIAADPHYFHRLVTLGCANKRKMLRNNLAGEIDRDRLLGLLNQLQIPENVRAEDLSTANWVALSNKMLEECSAP